MDEMFFTPDMRSLRRGKRAAPRTEICRPCLLWVKGNAGTELQGVAMDVSPYGFRIRMLGALPPDTPVVVQMMRDEDFEVPLSNPVEGKVVRIQPEDTGFTDHGVQLEQKEIRRIESKPLRVEKRRPRRTRRSRMYSFDVTVGERRRGRFGR